METQLFNTAQTNVFAAQSEASKDRLNQLATSKSDDRTAMRKTAEDFEAVFLSQMLRPMFETLPTDTMMGGGQAESVYRGLMVEEMGKSIAKSGGVGIADSVFRELLKLQEG